MKLTNEQIILAQRALASYRGRDDLNKLFALALIRNGREIDQARQDIMEVQQDLFQKHVARDDEGEPLNAKDENGAPIPDEFLLKDQDAYNAEITEVLQDEIDLNIKTCSIEQFPDTISPQALIALEFMLDE